MLPAVDIETADQQLRRERAAVNKLRGILCTYPAVRKELREASPQFLGCVANRALVLILTVWCTSGAGDNGWRMDGFGRCTSAAASGGRLGGRHGGAGWQAWWLGQHVVLPTQPAPRLPLQMLWRVDQGEAANVSGVPDPALKGQLVEFLELLRLKRNDKVRCAKADTASTYGISCKVQARDV